MPLVDTFPWRRINRLSLNYNLILALHLCVHTTSLNWKNFIHQERKKDKSCIISFILSLTPTLFRFSHSRTKIKYPFQEREKVPFGLLLTWHRSVVCVLFPLSKESSIVFFTLVSIFSLFFCVSLKIAQDKKSREKTMSGTYFGVTRGLWGGRPFSLSLFVFALPFPYLFHGTRYRCVPTNNASTKHEKRKRKWEEISVSPSSVKVEIIIF